MSRIEDAFKLQRSIEKGEPQMTHPFEPNITDAKQRVLDLYKPPFRYFADIWTVGSEDGSGATVCKVDDHADGELISEALTEYYAKRQKCAVHGYGCGMQEATCQSI